MKRGTNEAQLAYPLAQMIAHRGANSAATGRKIGGLIYLGPRRFWYPRQTMSSPSTNQPFRFSVDSFGGMPSGGQPSNPLDAADDGLLRETRKELRRLVADVASLCHSRIDQQRFWPKYLGLVGTAIAAEAGIVWQRQSDRWQHVTHCGPLESRIFDPQAAPGHANMIAEIGDAAGPVAVPHGSDWDSEEPGNPTQWLAAVVPVPVDPDEPVQWLVEIFLPAGGGPATQRGYLRFLAQMTDLAAEYMRAQRLRQATWAADFSQRAGLMLTTMLDLTSDPNFQEHLVDAVCQFASAERVSLVCQNSGRGKVTAVSGATSIDRYSPVVRMIQEVAGEVEPVVGMITANPEDLHLQEQQVRSEINEVDSPITTIQSGDLILRGVAVLDPHGRWRLVIEDDQAVELTSDELSRWKTLARQLGGLLEHHDHIVHSGLRRLFSSRISQQPSWLRRSFVPLGIAATIIIAGLIPVPMVVKASGHLQPEFTQIVYAPRSAVVTDVLVEHDQQVKIGQPILRLEDNELDRQIEQITSRLAILAQQSSTLKDEQTMVEARDGKMLANLTLQQRAIEEESRGLASQLDICVKNRDQLLLHANVDGHVDAWQLRQTLHDRPVERGQPLLRIVPENETWIVQAKIPEDRLDLLLDLQRTNEQTNEPVAANLVMSAFPDHQVSATLLEIGPVSIDDQSKSMALATFAISTNDLPVIQSGAPVEIGIPCGPRPLAYVAGLDLIRMTSQTIQLYW